MKFLFRTPFGLPLALFVLCLPLILAQTPPQPRPAIRANVLEREPLATEEDRIEAKVLVRALNRYDQELKVLKARVTALQELLNEQRTEVLKFQSTKLAEADKDPTEWMVDFDTGDFVHVTIDAPEKGSKWDMPRPE